MQKTILVLVAENFEEIELVAPVDIWRRAGYQTILASINNDKNVKGQQGLQIMVDMLLEEVNIHNMNLLYIPGGSAYKTIQSSTKCMDLIKRSIQEKKLIAAICAGPLVIAEYLSNKKATCYPTMQSEIKNWIDAPVVVDKPFITSQSAGTSLDFAFSVVEILDSFEKASQLKKILVYKDL